MFTSSSLVRPCPALPAPVPYVFRVPFSGIRFLFWLTRGSSHNIVQPRIAEFLGLAVTPLAVFPIMVGNGASLRCSGVCHGVPLLLQNHCFDVSLFVIPIYGADVVLGVQWLSSLGPFVSDFSIPSMQFYHSGQLVTLSGQPASTPTYASFNQLRRYVATDAIQSYCLLSVHPSGSPTSSVIPLHTYPHDLYTLLSQFESVFSGLIRPSTSPFSSPVLLVRKKDGTWRFCVDYRGLNAITVQDRFPIPTVDELLDELHGASIFSKIDLRAGYHQIRVAPDDIPKTAFRTIDGHFEFLVMPFGLTNAPSTFQAVMNDVFRPFLRRFVLVFFDDILIYSSSWNSHLTHLSQVLQTLQAHCLYAKLSKCIFGADSVDYLGHVVSALGVAADPNKLQAVADWPTPVSFTGLRAFLGLTGYYRKFVRAYASLASPLTDLLKSKTFQWTAAADTAFAALKCAMVSLPVLRLPDFSLPFDVTTDASQTAIGAVLSQQQHPIAYFSKS
ncbi:UNVERIFIED_CONTAM: Retrovirus-related Pol polyprotein from transposon.6 [Sesamum radiatum]|uniref:Retrovirus-related Pol polyprotein from transposon.6 n=1 Tax=Sesamum radiatum TaxID=300843 RepID=A0AAW2U7X8_SESRA